MKFFLLINVEMTTVVGISTLMRTKHSILGLSEPERNAEFLDIFILMRMSMKIFYKLGTRFCFAQSLPLLPSHHSEMTEILLKKDVKLQVIHQF